VKAGPKRPPETIGIAGLQITVGGRQIGAACACPGVANNAAAGATNTTPAPPIAAAVAARGRVGGFACLGRPPTPIALLRLDMASPPVRGGIQLQTPRNGDCPQMHRRQIPAQQTATGAEFKPAPASDASNL
jgi:hypothetical protein